jgi:antitoxin YefM
MTEYVALAEMKNRLSEFVERIDREHDRVIITKHGHPAAVVMSIDDLESLEETLAILSDPGLMAQIRESDADISAGRAERVTKDQLLIRLANRSS